MNILVFLAGFCEIGGGNGPGTGSSADLSRQVRDAQKRRDDIITQSGKPEKVKEVAKDIQKSIDKIDDEAVMAKLKEISQSQNIDQFLELITSDKGLTLGDKLFLNPKKLGMQILGKLGLGVGVASLALSIWDVRNKTKIGKEDSSINELVDTFRSIQDALSDTLPDGSGDGSNSVLTAVSPAERFRREKIWTSMGPEFHSLVAKAYDGQKLTDDERNRLTRLFVTYSAKIQGRASSIRRTDITGRELNPTRSLAVDPDKLSYSRWEDAVYLAELFASDPDTYAIGPLVNFFEHQPSLKEQKVTTTEILKSLGYSEYALVLANSKGSVFLGDIDTSQIFKGKLTWRQAQEVGTLWHSSGAIPNATVRPGQVKSTDDPYVMRAIIKALPKAMQEAVSILASSHSARFYFVKNDTINKMQNLLLSGVSQIYSNISTAISAVDLWRKSQKALQER